MLVPRHQLGSPPLALNDCEGFGSGGCGFAGT